MLSDLLILVFLSLHFLQAFFIELVEHFHPRSYAGHCQLLRFFVDLWGEARLILPFWFLCEELAASVHVGLA